MAAKAQKGFVLNPVSLSDDQVTEKVYKTHVRGGEKYNVEPLWNVVLNIVERSTEIADSIVLKGAPPSIERIENKAPISHSLNTPLRVVKPIAIKMIKEAECKGSAHETTMWILEKLRTYSWDAKAILTLAAFAFNYGNFWHLTQVNPTTDSFGSQLALLNRVAIVNDPQSIDKLGQKISDVNNLVKTVLEVIKCIIELETLSSKGYDAKEVPGLVDAKDDIPLDSYWAIITTVACAAQMEFLFGDWDHEIDLHRFKTKLSIILDKQKSLLTNIKKQIEEFEDHRRRKEGLQTSTEIVDVLKILIYPKNTQHHQVFDGAQTKVSIEVFRQKHALLFISGLDSIWDEVRLLESIHRGLKQDTEEVNGYKKKDFKILWIPIVDDWNKFQKEQFAMLKSKMPWYVVEYFSPLAGIRLIREVLGYKDKPIVPLMNRQGKIINSNALHTIFVWGIEAFPFRPEDDEHLSEKSKWFWSPITEVFQEVRVWINEDKYIFIYGGTPEWMKSIAKAVEAIKKKADAIIEHYQFGKDDSKIVNHFWDHMESLFQEKLLKKPHDSVFDNIRELLCLKHDRKGWVILSKGSNIKLLCRADAALRTVEEFETWKGDVLEKVGFDVAFRENYGKKLKEGPPQCAFMQLANFPSNVLEPISCPDLKCGRLMDIANVSYKCCHGCKPNGLEKDVSYKCCHGCKPAG